ncbi:Bromodomain-containing protein [Backusella circina FSU 941]|nr:Bromodomain-containing protein [Backusella circina FSU 941]
MDVDIKPQPIPEEFEEIESPKPSLEKRSRTTSSSPSLAACNSSNKTNMTRDQVKYCGAIMRNLKKHRDASAFLHPVDYVRLNVPDYPKIIKHPMDLSTVDRRLHANQYQKVEDFVEDIRLVFNNCFKFNGPEAMISMLCQNVESAFEKSLRQMPPSRGSTPPPRAATPDDDYEMSERTKSVKKKMNLSHASPLRRSTEEHRPKREVSPLSNDYYYDNSKKKNKNHTTQMKFCLQAVKELKKNKYRDINYPFLEPVDVVALNIPDYLGIVKRPMDLSTIEKKLNKGAYDSPEEFEDDIRLMFNNCYLYNPATLPINKMGHQLERVFDEKWAQKPEPVTAEPAVEQNYNTSKTKSRKEIIHEDEDDESVDDERDQKIAELERHIATISQQIASIKSQKKKKAADKPPRRPSAPRPKEKKVAPKEKRKRVPATNNVKRKQAVPDELPEFTFDQKKDLSERINNLTGDRLNTVVNIIQSSMPNLDGQGQEEIVLDIDSLDRSTLHRLHEFVTGESLIKKNNSLPQPKRPRTHYSAADTDRKIRELQNTLNRFNSDPDSSSESESESESGSDTDESGSGTD